MLFIIIIILHTYYVVIAVVVVGGVVVVVAVYCSCCHYKKTMLIVLLQIVSCGCPDVSEGGECMQGGLPWERQRISGLVCVCMRVCALLLCVMCVCSVFVRCHVIYGYTIPPGYFVEYRGRKFTHCFPMQYFRLSQTE
jgi:hypothetical protein